jgi:hypothetical protein
LSIFAALPANPLTRIADIDSNYLKAPRNSIAAADVEHISFRLREVHGKKKHDS